MLTISNTKMNAIEASYRKQRRLRLAADFRKNYPPLAHETSDQQLLEYLGLVIENCKELGITQDKDIIDCAAIGLLIKQSERNIELIALISRTLNNQTWDVKTRLNFIWAHILGD